MSRASQEQIAKLPKWAQEEIALLTMRLNEARQEIATLHGQHPVSRVSLNPQGDIDGKPEFRNEYTVLRVGDPTTHHTRGLHAGLARIESNALKDYIMEVRGEGTIEVLPSASNVVHIRLSRR